MRKILIMGLPGAGKTTLASALAPPLNAVVFNADAVRVNLSRDLGFSHMGARSRIGILGLVIEMATPTGFELVTAAFGGQGGVIATARDVHPGIPKFPLTS